MSKHVLKHPVITEKSLMLANGSRTYTFEVDRSANKDQIKVAVEKMYGVNVVSVNTVMRQSDEQRTGRRRLTVTVAKTKKALVTLKEGQVIELFDISQA